MPKRQPKLTATATTHETSAGRAPDPDPDPDPQRERILDAFSERAKRAGIRGVLMGELASELRMSATTLYKRFASKEELTLACVERWAAELAAMEATLPRAGQQRDGYGQFTQWAEAWADAVGSLSPAFLEDLKRDYPVAYQRFQEETRRRQRRGAAMLRTILRPDIDERIAFDLLNAIMSRVTRPEYAERMRVTRREAMRSALAVWAAGALQRKGELKEIKPGAKRKTGPTAKANTKTKGNAPKR